MPTRLVRSLGVSALICLAAPVAAQQGGSQGGAPNPAAQQAEEAQEMLLAAYALRRAGEFQPAAAAFEQALERLPRGEEKRAVAMEAAELYRTMQRLDKALWLFRRNHDVGNEVQVLLDMGKVDEALTVARLLHYPKGEALALAKRGKIDEALRLYQEQGMHQERAELLRDQKRWADAAAAFALAGDAYAQAQMLEAGGKRTEATAAYEAARDQVLARMKVETIPMLNRAKRYFEQEAASGLARERARLELARRCAAAADDYEKMAVIHLRLGREKADALADNAIRSVRLQQQTLLDEIKGPDGKPLQDAYGKKLGERLELEKRLAGLERLKAETLRARPPAPPGKR